MLTCIQFLRTNWICYKSYPELLLLNLIILSQCLTEAQLEVD